jgi:peptide/nickel transport system substrate-binding protein
VKAATIVQDDLRQLGMKVSVVSLESRSMADRVFNRREYDAAIMAIDSGDLDPNSEMNVWVINGSMHIWNLSGHPKFPWEEQIDRHMKSQMTSLDRADRKRVYDRVQRLISEHLPFIFMTTPHVLVAASQNIGNVAPSIIRPNLLWNADCLYLRSTR